jgi:PAS domain S-box-containing protein
LTRAEELNFERRLNEELHEKNQELELIFNSSYDEIFVTDGQGVTLRINSACKRYYGVPEEELVGKSAEDLEKLGVFDQSVTREVIKTKQRVTMFQTTSTGRYLLVSANPVKNENGEIVRIVCNSKDLTEVSNLKKKLEEMEGLVQKYDNELKEFKELNAIQTPDYLYNSKIMENIMMQIKKISETNATVLLLGESGVGKTLLAKKIHENSYRKEKPFVKINCGAIPENLIESELFGYVEGAFTGAKKSGKKGVIESANGGTLFLDEIGEIPLHLQVKLLHVLQEKEIKRVGDSTSILVDVRIVSATNKNLEKMVEENKFREDLFYRLSVIPIEIPSLKNRREDILPLINYYFEKMNQKHDSNVNFSSDVINTLIEYDWPGNIRELENLIERLVVTSRNDEVKYTDLPHKFLRTFNPVPDFKPISLKTFLEKQEKELFLSLYNQYSSSYKIADVLDISQSTANRKLRKHLSQI